MQRFVIVSSLVVCFAATALAHDGDEGEAGHSHGKAGAANPTVMTTRPGARSLPPTKEDDTFHFVVYGDRTGGVPAGLKILEQAVADTNLLDPDLVMTVGDLIQGYNETPEWLAQMRRYREIMSELSMPWFPVAGNHDVYWRGKGEAPQGQHDSNYEEHFGPLWYSFQHKGSGFIVLYSDEGDPATNEKAFNSGKLQMMSEQQLAFLDKALAELKDCDHVFCFLHHPRWIGGGYTGSNWPTVHQKLVGAGNVSAVFAGHIHHMRYDGPKDGIEYFTLATTGGHLSADIPKAGYLHHLNLVTVREDRISVSALAIGSVLDPREFTPEYLADIDAARSIRPVAKGKSVIVRLDGSANGEVSYAIRNPCKHDVHITAALSQAPGGMQWRDTLDHAHFTLTPGQEETISFRVARDASDEPSQLPSLALDVELLTDSARVALPRAEQTIDIRPEAVPADYFANSPNKCLKISGADSALRVDSADIKLPAGSMTLEAWVKPIDLPGFRGMIAKTESSEYAFFSDEGVPQFDINLDGKYYSAKATDKLSTTKWTHLAGVFDGSQVHLFVDGKLVSSVAAKGKRKSNDLPLWIGADPDRGGRPTRPFSGYIDEVRLSEDAIYAGEFTPERKLKPAASSVLMLHLDRPFGPFVLDHSPAASRATVQSKTEFVDVN
ncbi:MAG: metallophosphoesterase [Aureliella sp.]